MPVAGTYWHRQQKIYQYPLPIIIGNRGEFVANPKYSRRLHHFVAGNLPHVSLQLARFDFEKNQIIGETLKKLQNSEVIGFPLSNI